MIDQSVELFFQPALPALLVETIAGSTGFLKIKENFYILILITTTTTTTIYSQLAELSVINILAKLSHKNKQTSTIPVKLHKIKCKYYKLWTIGATTGTIRE